MLVIIGGNTVKVGEVGDEWANIDNLIGFTALLNQKWSMGPRKGLKLIVIV